MSDFKVKPEHLKGCIANFPLHVVQEMINEQVRQGNPANPSVFAKKIAADKNQGGFDWSKHKWGWAVWNDVITCVRLSSQPHVKNILKVEVNYG